MIQNMVINYIKLYIYEILSIQSFFGGYPMGLFNIFINWYFSFNLDYSLVLYSTIIGIVSRHVINYIYDKLNTRDVKYNVFENYVYLGILFLLLLVAIYSYLIKANDSKVNLDYIRLKKLENIINKQRIDKAKSLFYIKTFFLDKF